MNCLFGAGMTITLLGALFFAPIAVMAQSTTTGNPTGITITPSKVPQIIDKVSQWLYTIIISVSLLFFLMSGYLYLTAKPENIKKANAHLLFGAAGVGIAILAFSITSLVKFFLQ